VYALFTEVNADGSQDEAARKFLNEFVVPRARQSGATAGYWLAAKGGRGVSIVIFDKEKDARTIAGVLTVGEPPGPGAPDGVTVRTVEVREVIASV